MAKSTYDLSIASYIYDEYGGWLRFGAGLEPHLDVVNQKQPSG
jgi:hypothetical protein